jgi:hypothetical protein
MLIYTLTIDCVWGRHLEEPCRRIIEIEETDTLYGLHTAIQAAVNFENDHPFEFYAARTERSRPRYPIGAEAAERGRGRSDRGWLAGFAFDEPPTRHAAGTAWAARLAVIDDPELRLVFPLPERLKLYYWFDFGDDWKFEIRKARQGKEPASRVTYPHVIQRIGPDPEQYPNLDEH